MTIRPALWWCLASVMFTVTGLAQEVSVSQKPKLKAFTIVNPARDANGNMLRPADASASSALATFNYTTVSSRDGNTYSGVMVGQDPFSSGPFTTTTVDTPIIPLIITTKSVAFKVSKGGILSRIKGFTTFDPTVADNACLSSPNNVPIGLAVQSPIFQATDFSFGPTSVGTTQYIDAFQRGNFSLQGTDYHTVLNPHMLPPVHLVFPANEALAIPSGLFGSCGPLGIVNINTIFPVLLKLLAAATLLGELRQALSATVGSNVVNPLILERIPPLLTLKATDFVVMIKGMIGVSTVVVVNGPAGKWILSHHYPGVSVAVAAGDGCVIECRKRAAGARVGWTKHVAIRITGWVNDRERFKLGFLRNRYFLGQSCNRKHHGS